MTVRSIILMPLLAVLGALYMQTGGDPGDVVDGLTRATPLENWQIIAAAVGPGIMALIIRSSWSRSTQTYATIAVSVGTAFVVALLSDPGIIVPEVVIRGLELFALTVISYYGAWKPTGAAPKIEAATGGKPLALAGPGPA